MPSRACARASAASTAASVRTRARAENTSFIAGVPYSEPNSSIPPALTVRRSQVDEGRLALALQHDVEAELRNRVAPPCALRDHRAPHILRDRRQQRIGGVLRGAIAEVHPRVQLLEQAARE